MRVSWTLILRNACKIKKAYILSPVDDFKSPPPLLSPKHKKMSFFFRIFPRKKAHFWGFWRQFWYGRPPPPPVSRRQNMSFFYFARIPKYVIALAPNQKRPSWKVWKNITPKHSKSNLKLQIIGFKTQSKVAKPRMSPPWGKGNQHGPQALLHRVNTTTKNY